MINVAARLYFWFMHKSKLDSVDVCALQLAEQLTPLDVFLGLTAAAAHDVDHPGVNQTFLINTRHHLASLYQVHANVLMSVGVRVELVLGLCFDRSSSCAEHLCAGESPLEVHCGHVARVRTAVPPAG